MNKPQFVYVTYIESTAEAVWQALTDPAFTQRYWGGLRVESDWAVGSPVRAVHRSGGVGWQGEVQACDPPRLLSYTFHMLISEEKRAEPPSRVSFEIEALDRMVKLTLIHDYATAGATFEDTRNGWPAILSSLKSLLERGEALPFSRLGFGPSAAKDVGRIE